MHWPTMEERPSRQAITSLPGVQNGVLVILADSARFHYNAIRAEAPGCLVVWRGLPQPNRRPMDLRWDLDVEPLADECFNLWNEQHEEHVNSGVEWFTPLNELQFERESGEPFAGFGVVAERLGRLRGALRRRFSDFGQDVRLIFPAWCPDQPNFPTDAPFVAANEWLDEAMAWDAIGMHVYSHSNIDAAHTGGSNVTRTHAEMRRLLREKFGDAGVTKPIVYTEMNANFNVNVSEREMLVAAANVCASDPNCLGYAWYIWETQREGETSLSVFGNDARLALFQNPPGATPPPEPEPMPDELLAIRQSLRQVADNAALSPLELRTELQRLISEIEV
jgi:hypothetical protein